MGVRVEQLQTLMMPNKKLGLLLLPLLPLTAIGIVEVADRVMPASEPAPQVAVQPTKPKPAKPNPPPPAPQPAPQPPRPAPAK